MGAEFFPPMFFFNKNKGKVLGVPSEVMRRFPCSRYACASALDVSQSVLNSAYLGDGEVTVTAKISNEVDGFTTPEGYLLDAEVVMHCAGVRAVTSATGDCAGIPGGGSRCQAAVEVNPLAKEMLVVSANEQGEGASTALRFVDRATLMCVYMYYIYIYMYIYNNNDNNNNNINV